ncbi:MAG: hypothetical protein ACK442_03710, partial [Novosphingobium sp.]
MSAPGLRQAGSLGERLAVGLALTISLVLVWFASGDVLVLAVFVGGLIALGGIAWLLNRSAPTERPVEYA